MQGKFIVIEGLDGAGKSTATGFIREYLKQKNFQTIYTREPGGTKVAENIRNLALEIDAEEPLYSDTELLLMYASRVQHIRSLIEPSLERGINVVSDRFYWSSIAYQGGGRGLDISKIEALNEHFVKNCEPDLTIYLDIDPAIGLYRAKKVGHPDRIEQSGIEFFARARKVFKRLVIESKNAIEIDAAQSMEIIKKQIYQTLDKYF